MSECSKVGDIGRICVFFNVNAMRRCREDREVCAGLRERRRHRFEVIRREGCVLKDQVVVRACCVGRTTDSWKDGLARERALSSHTAQEDGGDQRAAGDDDLVCSHLGGDVLG